MPISLNHIALEIQALIERLAVRERTSTDLRAIIRARQERDKLFPADLFHEPAWNMLLDLMLAQQEGRLISVSSLCIAAGVPGTTALRWIEQMTKQGLLSKRPDPADGRRHHIALSDRAADAMARWMQTAEIASAN